MDRLATSADLEKLQLKLQQERDPDRPCITVCLGTGCHAYDNQKVFDALEQEIKSRGLTGEITLRGTGCHGFCEQGPIVIIFPELTLYCRVKPDDAPDIVAGIQEGSAVERLLYTDPVTGQSFAREPEIPFYRHQQQLVFGRNKLIDPKNIEDYIAAGGYRTLARTLAALTPEQVLDEIKRANLRGRGGGGFPAGDKWEVTRQAPGDKKYVIVNADEGDPGAYMDRSLLEGNPHLILEGLLIGGYAIGTEEGYVYVRQEYPLAVENINMAVKQAEACGLLGDNILGSGFNFRVTIKRGAGAFVSGESSALMASLEGGVGEPRPKHINTAIKGLWDRPTNLNNVETWANVPLILEHGWEWFSRLGTANNPGTKIFSLVGNVNNTGLIEVPMGTTLRTIIYQIGGGIPGDKKFKAVQTGGPSGGCIPESLLDTPVDFDSLNKLGAMMGSGGMIVMDENNCMVDVARYFTNFLQGESCGKCTSCREGLRRMHEILEKITAGEGTEADLDLLEELAVVTRNTSMCALGKTAANPVLSTLKYFRQEYLAHIKEKKCPGGICKALITYKIDPALCTNCGRCVRLCPAQAITENEDKGTVINPDLCDRCGICREACRFGAVHVE